MIVPLLITTFFKKSKMMSAFTDLALMQFVTIYQEVCPQEKKIDTNELFKLMQEAIKENSLSPSSSRSNSPPRAFVGALAASEASEELREHRKE